MSEATGVTPEKALRTYFRGKDENRPYLPADVFGEDARLEINNRSVQISFPSVTLGREAIADVLVRHFNATYEKMIVLLPDYTIYVMRSLRKLDYP